MGDEEYRKFAEELMERILARMHIICENYILEDGELIAIGEMTPEDMKEIDRQCGTLKLDMKIDISRELAMLLRYSLETKRRENADS